jgi:hypothetical protein
MMVPCMLRNLGIILKRDDPAKSVYSILDQCEGVLVCSIAREDICAGACIEYSLSRQRTRLLADEVELIEFPCIATVADLLLLHRALEICVRCMPVGSITAGVFEHVRSLYDSSMSPLLRVSLVKKIFLCKLFALLGFYPHEKKFQNQFFHNLATETLDNLRTYSVSMVQEEDIEEWLQACIAMHTQEQKFKTRFLGEWVEII